MRKTLPDDYQGSRRELEVAEDGVADEALEGLKPLLQPGKEAAARIVLTKTVSKSHSGPIPSADELEQLEAVQPGLADRVVAMAEREQAHRHGTLETLMEKEFKLRGRGQWMALAALFLLLVAVLGIAWLGDTKAASWLGGATIAAVVSVFVTGRLFDAGEAKSPAQETPIQPKSQTPKALPSNKRGKRR